MRAFCFDIVKNFLANKLLDTILKVNGPQRNFFLKMCPINDKPITELQSFVT